MEESMSMDEVLTSLSRISSRYRVASGRAFAEGKDADAQMYREAADIVIDLHNSLPRFPESRR